LLKYIKVSLAKTVINYKICNYSDVKCKGYTGKYHTSTSGQAHEISLNPDINH